METETGSPSPKDRPHPLASLARLGAWSVALAVVIWLVHSFAKSLPGDPLWLSIIVGAAALLVVPKFGQSFVDALRLDPFRFPQTHWVQYARLALLFALFLVGVVLYRSPEPDGIYLSFAKAAGFVIAVVSVLGLLSTTLLLGINWPAQERAGRKIMRPAVGLRVASILAGGGCLSLAGVLIGRSLDGWGIGSHGMDLVLAFLIGIGAWFVLAAFLLRIDYDDTRICAQMDRFLNRRHCHRWANLTGVETTRANICLTFADGSRVVATIGITGYGELDDFARKVLARNRGSEGED